MEIKLKNIKFSEHLSEETNAFTADIFVNGKKVGYAKNDGHGGCTWYHPYSVEDRAIINEAEKYCLGLPPIKYSTLEIPMNLENKIDQLFEEWLKAKDEAKLQKKLQKDMLKALCIKTDGGYQAIKFKNENRNGFLNIAQVLAIEEKKYILKEIIDKAKSEGRIILNTNIPQELYQ